MSSGILDMVHMGKEITLLGCGRSGPESLRRYPSTPLVIIPQPRLKRHSVAWCLVVHADLKSAHVLTRKSKEDGERAARSSSYAGRGHAHHSRSDRSSRSSEGGITDHGAYSKQFCGSVLSRPHDGRSVGSAGTSRHCLLRLLWVFEYFRHFG
jgi:hypothetical protein